MKSVVTCLAAILMFSLAGAGSVSAQETTSSSAHPLSGPKSVSGTLRHDETVKQTLWEIPGLEAWLQRQGEPFR